MKLLKRINSLFTGTEREKLVSSRDLQAAIVQELRKHKITPCMAWLMQLGATMVMVSRQVKMTSEMKQVTTRMIELRNDYMEKNDISEALTEMYKAGYFKR